MHQVSAAADDLMQILILTECRILILADTMSPRRSEFPARGGLEGPSCPPSSSAGPPELGRALLVRRHHARGQHSAEGSAEQLRRLCPQAARQSLLRQEEGRTRQAESHDYQMTVLRAQIRRRGAEQVADPRLLPHKHGTYKTVNIRQSRTYKTVNIRQSSTYKTVNASSARSFDDAVLSRWRILDFFTAKMAHIRQSRPHIRQSRPDSGLWVREGEQAGEHLGCDHLTVEDGEGGEEVEDPPPRKHRIVEPARGRGP